MSRTVTGEDDPNRVEEGGNMIPITEVAKGVFRIGPLDTHNGGATPETSPYLVVGDKQAAIVEPGEGGQVPALLDGIREIGVGTGRIAHIISSHIHLHHIAGINHLLQAIPQAKFTIHHRGVPHVMDPTRLNASTLQVWGQQSGCPQITSVPEDRIWGVTGGEVLDLGGRELEIIETTGHAPHHISIFDRLNKAIFPGDAVGVLQIGKERARPDILPPLFELDIATASLQRLRALKPSVLFLFGYGGVSHSPDQTMQWSEDDIHAVERIVREGMQQKTSSQEIGTKVHEYYTEVGIAIPGEDGAEREAPIGMCAYVKRKHPELEMPEGLGGDYRGRS